MVSQNLSIIGQKKSLKDRLGGYAKPDQEKVAPKRAQREISVDSSPEPEVKLAKVDRKASSKAETKTGLTIKRRVILEDDIQDAGIQSDTLGGKSKISVTKRNIWSRREQAPEVIDVHNRDDTSVENKKPITGGVSAADLRKRADESKPKLSAKDRLREAAPSAATAHILPSESDDEIDLMDDDFPSEKIVQKPKKSEHRSAKISLTKKMFRTDSVELEGPSSRDRNSTRSRAVSRDYKEIVEQPPSRLTERRRTREVSESEDRKSGSRVSRMMSRDSEERLSRRAAWSASRKNRSQESNASDENRSGKPGTNNANMETCIIINYSITSLVAYEMINT